MAIFAKMGYKLKMENLTGKIIAVWKPAGPTSHDIINTIRRATGERRIGHAGTLDPLAQGILVIGIGRQATKKLSIIVASEKEYLAEIELGKESETDDAEGKITIHSVKSKPDQDKIITTLSQFLGQIKQIPPSYSAIKINGKPAYARVRAGEKVLMPVRQVFVKDISIINYSWPKLKIRVITGSGVYIRSLARDIGKNLGTGGYLASLERVRVGQFTKDRALSLSYFLNKEKKNHN